MKYSLNRNAPQNDDHHQRAKRGLPGDPPLASLIKPEAEKLVKPHRRTLSFHDFTNCTSFGTADSNSNRNLRFCNSIMAGAEGLELSTPGFGDRCSAN